MGGLFTPISSMPGWAQAITYAVPPRYFIEIARGIYIKGSTFGDLVPQYMAMAIFAIAGWICAIISYRKKA